MSDRDRDRDSMCESICVCVSLSTWRLSQDPMGEDMTAVKAHMLQFLDDSLREAAGVHFTPEEFLDYLYSKHNSIWDEKQSVVVQDMDQPMSHYWIASSHNTCVVLIASPHNICIVLVASFHNMCAVLGAFPHNQYTVLVASARNTTWFL